MIRSSYTALSIFLALMMLFSPFGRIQPGSPSASSATFAVTSTADLPDTDVNDNVCHASNSLCTLRAAIQQANFTTGADTITLPAGVFLLTRVGTNEDGAVNGDLDIIESLTITGAGSASSIVDANGSVTGERAFQILSSAANVTISGLTIRNGKTAGVFGEGGGLYWDGNGSHLTLTNVVIENSSSYYGGGVYLNYSSLADVVDLGHVTIHANSSTAAGAGLAAALGDLGTLSLHDSQVDSNTAYEGGGVYFQGISGTVDGLTASITNSAIFGNSASLSAGFENRGGMAAFPVTIQNSRIYQNHASIYGGGIGNFGALTINNTTIDSNTATSSATPTTTRGGGIYDYEGGILTINQSTLSRNTSASGGGLFSEYFSHNNSLVTLTNSTVSSNSASQDGAGIYADGGQIQLFNATLAANQVLVPAGDSHLGLGGALYVVSRVGFTFQNTLIADNSHRYGTAAASSDDCFGTINSLGYNLVEQTFDCAIIGSMLGVITGQDPRLEPLLNSIGVTQVQAPLTGSPAIDAGQTPACTDVNSAAITVDQRGVERPLGGRCDIGAVEYLPVEQFVPVIKK